MLERWLKPRTEHPDPKIRGEALAQLAADDPVFLAALRGDDDDEVRIRLLGVTTDLSLLQARAQDETQPAVAAAAMARLRALLAGGEEADNATRDAFVASVTNADLLAHVACVAPALGSRRLALDRHQAVAADHSALLVQVAGHDDDPTLRRYALDQLHEIDDLEQVAAATRKADKHLFKEVREKIRGLRQRVENEKSAARLAQQIEELAAQPVVANNDDMHRAVALLQNWREEWSRLVAASDIDLPDVTGPSATADAAIAAARDVITRRDEILKQLRDATEALDPEPNWRALWDALPDHTPTEQSRFEARLTRRQACLQRIAQRQHVLDEARRFLDEQAVRDDAHPARLAHIDKTWAGFGLPADAAGEELQQRFATLRDGLGATVDAAAAAQSKAADGIAELLDKLEQAVASGQLGPASSAHDKLNHQLRNTDALAPKVAAAAKKRLAAVAPKLRELLQARRWSTSQARDNLMREAETLTQIAAGLPSTELAKRVKALRSQWQALDKGVGPAEQETWTRFDTACRAAYAPAKAQFSEEAAKRREICERLEKFHAETDWSAPDWGAVVALLRDARKAWRETGQVEYRKFLKLRKRFDAAVAPLDARLVEERERDTRRRTLAIGALRACVERDPLDAQIDMAKRVQREWNPTVRGRRKEEQALWDELRTICDDIFARRDAKFSDRRAAEAAALAAKTDVCAQIDTLLANPGDTADPAVINQAKGQYQTLRDQWRDAGDVGPKKKSSALSQYRAASERFESRLKASEQQGHERQFNDLIARVQLLDEHRQRLAADEAADDQRDRWDALPALRGALGKKLDAAFAAPPVAATAADLEARQALCLRAELAAGIPSPPEFEQARMTLKIAQLKDALAGANQGTAKTVIPDFIEQWIAIGPAAADQAAVLRERFVAALRALGSAG